MVSNLITAESVEEVKWTPSLGPAWAASWLEAVPFLCSEPSQAIMIYGRLRRRWRSCGQRASAVQAQRHVGNRAVEAAGDALASHHHRRMMVDPGHKLAKSLRRRFLSIYFLPKVAARSGWGAEQKGGGGTGGADAVKAMDCPRGGCSSGDHGGVAGGAGTGDMRSACRQ